MPRLTSSPPHIHFFFHIPCLVFLCSLSHVAESQIPDQEQQVLFKLRQSWQDPSSLDHWVTSNSSSHCTWPEITCQDGSITELNLVNLNINYSIPPFFCDLKNLTKLDLSYNNIHGEFPTVLYHCSELVYLDLSQNYFEGPIPSDIDCMANLQVLILAANSFSFDIPASVARLWRLRILHLYQSEYNGTYPEEIFGLSNLEELSLGYNDKFAPSQLPQNFTALKKLRFFSMPQTNLFGRIPEKVSDMEALEHLDLGINPLTGEIPGSIFALRNLSRLYVYETNVSGSIPLAVSAANLSWIDLSANNLTGNIPEVFGKLKNLYSLNLQSNHLSGRIPEDIARLPALSDVRLSNNNLSARSPRTLWPIRPKLENAAYDASFLNNPRLCASNSFMRINVCNAQSHRSSKTNLTLIVILAIAAAICILLVVLFTITASRKNRDWFDSTPKLTSFQSLNFTESNILLGLKEHNVIGSGRSGKVYRIIVNPSGDTVAVKRISNNQKLNEKLEKQFAAEVEILGNIKHRHIVKLLCCISCENSKLLMYEYMENSSLDHWLHKKKRLSPISGVANDMILDWPKRLQIALGAAKGLCYMHHDCSLPIIHRDVKLSNILLDSEFNAKIADFGLARMLAKHGESCHVHRKYAHTTKVNEKIDVYSFGVILLELTTGREAKGGDEDMCLVDWAWRHILDGKAIADAIDEEINHYSFLGEISNVFKLGISCTVKRPSKRPPMKKVVQALLKCSDPLYVVEQTSRHNLDVAPLLRNPEHDEMPQSTHRLLRCNTY
ncbi:hypothetical protein EUGRSUZ_C00970 [Eucalyptus grandis]|uniref:Uncharacterized protein n=1 Tax=Eucalyptus grandis TaxID=71139 RepID=A0ACC3LC93_EUCGR|nr:hypothetical protein EUGRSUZ_C00970 [Eucalyptus grandis]